MRTSLPNRAACLPVFGDVADGAVFAFQRQVDRIRVGRGKNVLIFQNMGTSYDNGQRREWDESGHSAKCMELHGGQVPV